MKRTNMEVCCGTRNGYCVYRTVFQDGDHFYVKWNGNLVNVDKDIEERSYRYK